MVLIIVKQYILPFAAKATTNSAKYDKPFIQS